MKKKSRAIKSNLKKVDATPGQPDAEIPEVTRGMLAKAVFSTGGVKRAAMRPKGRPAGTGKKESTKIRFDRDVMAQFRATGPGWQTRMNDALREWLEAQPKRRSRPKRAG